MFKPNGGGVGCGADTNLELRQVPHHDNKKVLTLHRLYFRSYSATFLGPHRVETRKHYFSLDHISPSSRASASPLKLNKLRTSAMLYDARLLPYFIGLLSAILPIKIQVR